MRGHRLVVNLMFVVVAPWPCPARAGANDPTKSFAFANSQYILTAESSGPRSFVLNVINLSDFVIVIQPNEFIYRGESGRFYIGQVFDQAKKDARGEVIRYSASVLIKAHSFTGLTLLGAFREQDRIEELSLRIGARRYYFETLDKGQFETLARKVGELDLDAENPRASVEAANIEPLGTVKTTDGTSDWDKDWNGLIAPTGEIPPKIIERPEIEPTGEAIKARTYGRVRLTATITRNGSILDLKVEKGLGRGLDERAMEGVRNSWVFLPATKNGEVVETVVRFEVEFPPPGAVRKP